MTDTLPRVEPGARAERRRRRALRRKAALALAVLVPVGVLIAVAVSQFGNETPVAAPGGIGAAADGDQITYLLIGTRADDPSGQADSLTLLAVDRAGTKPVTLFVPTSTLTEIPGYGFDVLGRAMALGRVPLQEVAFENLLGITVDHTLVAASEFFAKLVDRAGGIEITVPERLLAPSGPDRLVPVFEAGKQRMNGVRAVRYLLYRGESDDELARFVRAQQVWEGLFARFPGAKAAELSRVVAGFGASLITDAAPGEAGSFLAAFAAAGADARAYRTLPVDAVGSGGPEDAFRVDRARLEELTSTVLAGSLPPAGPGRGARVQILNGNGEPEIGLTVAARLVPAGFRVADTGNARSFDFRRTKIVVYREADLPIADRIRALLGVGSIEISRTQQSIVDVTVVVGRDFAAEGS